MPQWSDRYDLHFKKYSKRYFGPGFDWRWFKAQAIVESGLDPKATGPTGARGVMQIRPSTYAEIKEDNPHFLELEDPRWNIAAGIYYDRIMYKRWRKRIGGREHLFFAFGSYNAGYGRVSSAYRRAASSDGEVTSWAAVSPFAPRLTRQYVHRIRGLMGSGGDASSRGVAAPDVSPKG